MEPAYLYGFEKYSKEFNILNENPVICKRIEDIILKTKKDYHNHIVENLERMKIPTEEMIHDLRGKCDFERNNTINDILSLLQDTNPKE